jgi:hypothetical protein
METSMSSLAGLLLGIVYIFGLDATRRTSFIRACPFSIFNDKPATAWSVGWRRGVVTQPYARAVQMISRRWSDGLFGTLFQVIRVLQEKRSELEHEPRATRHRPAGKV